MKTSNATSQILNFMVAKAVIVPARAAYEVTRCFDCPYFKEYGAPYQDGNTCQHDSVDYPLVSGYEIPEWCPELKEVNPTH